MKIPNSQPFAGWQFSRSNTHGDSVFLKLENSKRLEQEIIEVQSYSVSGEIVNEVVYPLTIDDAKNLVSLLQTAISKAEFNKNVVHTVKVSIDYDALYENINAGIKMYGLCYPYKDENGITLEKSVPVNLQKMESIKWVECGTIGVQYFSAKTKDEFIEKCKKYKVEYFPLTEDV